MAGERGAQPGGARRWRHTTVTQPCSTRPTRMEASSLAMAAALTFSPRLFFPAAPAGLPDFLPTLRAYSGVRVHEAKPLFEEETLARSGALEIKLATKAK